MVVHPMNTDTDAKEAGNGQEAYKYAMSHVNILLSAMSASVAVAAGSDPVSELLTLASVQDLMHLD